MSAPLSSPFPTPPAPLAPANVVLPLKQVLVVSDNERLATVLEFNLRPTARVTLFLATADNTSPPSQQWDLIIVALSYSDTEPIYALARAALLGQAWQAPLLVISDRPFPSEPDRHVHHLHFPFHTEVLQRRVQEMLA